MCTSVFTHCWDSRFISCTNSQAKFLKIRGLKSINDAASHIVTSRQSVIELFQVDFKSPVSHIFHQSVTFLYMTDSGDYPVTPKPLDGFRWKLEYITSLVVWTHTDTQIHTVLRQRGRSGQLASLPLSSFFTWLFVSSTRPQVVPLDRF